MTEDDWDAVIGVHLRGSFLMTRAVPGAHDHREVRPDRQPVVVLGPGQPRPGQLLGGQGRAPGLHQDPRHRAGPVRRHRQRGRSRVHPDRHDRDDGRAHRRLRSRTSSRTRPRRSRCSGSASPRTSRRPSRSCAPRTPASSPARSSTSPAARSTDTHRRTPLRPAPSARRPQRRPARRSGYARWVPRRRSPRRHCDSAAGRLPSGTLALSQTVARSSSSDSQLAYAQLPLGRGSDGSCLAASAPSPARKRSAGLPTLAVMSTAMTTSVVITSSAGHGALARGGGHATVVLRSARRPADPAARRARRPDDLAFLTDRSGPPPRRPRPRQPPRPPDLSARPAAMTRPPSGSVDPLATGWRRRPRTRRGRGLRAAPGPWCDELLALPVHADRGAATGHPQAYPIGSACGRLTDDAFLLRRSFDRRCSCRVARSRRRDATVIELSDRRRIPGAAAPARPWQS